MSYYKSSDKERMAGESGSVSGCECRASAGNMRNRRGVQLALSLYAKTKGADGPSRKLTFCGLCGRAGHQDRGER